MAQKKSLRCSFKSHQRAGWHHDYYHWTLGPHSGAGLAHFSRREDIWECHGVPRPQRLVWGGLLDKEGPAEPSAAAKLSAVAFFATLGGCSMLTCSVLSSSEKDEITGMLS